MTFKWVASLLSFKQQLIQRCEWVMTPMTWLMRKTWLGESRTCIALSKATKWHPQFTYRWWLFWMTKIHCEMTAICDQMSEGCEPNKSTDEESQRQFGLPKSQEKNWNKTLTCQSVMVCLLDPFTLLIFMHNKIQKLYPKLLEELKLGFDPLLAAKKEWFMVLPNWSFAAIYQNEQKLL